MKYLFLFFALTGCSNELVAQLNFIVSTDKSVYSYSDPILISITARNFGSTPDTLIFPTACQAGYYIDSVNYMHNGGNYITCEQVFTDRIIPPNDSTNWDSSYWLYNFTGAMVGGGLHAVVGWIGYVPNGWTSDTLWIRVTTPTGVFSREGTPNNYSLENNYPNPFNPATIIRYQLPTQSRVTLIIYNLLGEEVKTLVNDIQNAGYQNAQFDAGSLASGMYFSRLEAASTTDPGKIFMQVRKMALMK